MVKESYIQLPPDSTGKRVRAIERTVDKNVVFEEVQQSLLRNITDVPPDKTVTKINFSYDADGDVTTIEFLENSTVLFTLTFNYDAEKKITSITRT